MVKTMLNGVSTTVIHVIIWIWVFWTRYSVLLGFMMYHGRSVRAWSSFSNWIMLSSSCSGSNFYETFGSRPNRCLSFWKVSCIRRISRPLWRTTILKRFHKYCIRSLRSCCDIELKPLWFLQQHLPQIEERSHFRFATLAFFSFLGLKLLFFRTPELVGDAIWSI